MKDTVFSYIDTLENLAVELETGLCKYPAISPDSGGEGELDKCLFLETWLKAHGISQLERYDAPDPRAKGGVRPNLIATLSADANGGDASGGDASGRLWIMSHLDVVPPGEDSLWKSDPWTLVRADDGPLGPRIIGRGVEDNQQGLTSSVMAALAFAAQGLKPGLTVKLLFVADEEMGSAYGIDWLLKNHKKLFQKNDMVLIPDSGDSKGETIEVAEKNIVWARIVTRGKQAHGSRPDQGANAHLAGADFAVRLHHELSKKFGDHDPLFEPDYSTFQPTKKEANVPNINTIPGEDVFCMDMRILPRYPIKTVLAEIDRIKAEIETQYKVKIEYTLPQCMESRATSADAPLIKCISRAINEVYGVNPRPIGIGGGTVGAFLRNAGIDSAVWAKIGHSAHEPNEFALIANILGDAKVMALLMSGPVDNTL
jgi:succinyl-diaminopimelate desuccinylase